MRVVWIVLLASLTIRLSFATDPTTHDNVSEQAVPAVVENCFDVGDLPISTSRLDLECEGVDQYPVYDHDSHMNWFERLVTLCCSPRNHRDGDWPVPNDLSVKEMVPSPDNHPTDNCTWNPSTTTCDNGCSNEECKSYSSTKPCGYDSSINNCVSDFGPEVCGDYESPVADHHDISRAIDLTAADLDQQLLTAIEANDVNTIVDLLRTGADVNANGGLPLITASQLECPMRALHALFLADGIDPSKALKTLSGDTEKFMRLQEALGEIQLSDSAQLVN
jgi:hypothetical protein